MVRRPRVPDPMTAMRPPPSTARRGVDGTGRRFDEHGLLVGQVVGDVDELVLVGDEQGRPPAAGRLAEAGLEAGLEVPEGDALAQVRPPAGALVTGRVDAPDGAREDRDEDDAATVVGVAHDLVAGYERERHDRLEVAGGVPVDRREVGPADPGEAGSNPHPLGAGQFGRVDVGQPKRPDPRTPARRQPPGDGRGRVPRHLPLEQQRLHRRPPPHSNWGQVVAHTATCCPQFGGSSAWSGAMGRIFLGAPPARSQCSTSQPRLRAMAASFVSGFTATGIPGRLEQRQVRGRVGVGDATRPGRSRWPRSSRRAPGRGTRRSGGTSVISPDHVPSGRTRHRRADDVVEQRADRVDDDVEGAGDEERPVAEGTVLPHAPHRRGERLHEEVVGGELDGVGPQLLDRRALVAPVEVAQEVAPVLAVHGEQPGRLGQGLQRRSGRGRPTGSRRVASHEYEATTFDAMSVFSRSKAATWRAGSSTWRRSRCSRPSRPDGPGVVLTRACSTTDGQVDLRARSRPSR